MLSSGGSVVLGRVVSSTGSVVFGGSGVSGACESVWTRFGGSIFGPPRESAVSASSSTVVGLGVRGPVGANGSLWVTTFGLGGSTGCCSEPGGFGPLAVYAGGSCDSVTGCVGGSVVYSGGFGPADGYAGGGSAGEVRSEPRPTVARGVGPSRPSASRAAGPIGRRISSEVGWPVRLAASASRVRGWSGPKYRLSLVAADSLSHFSTRSMNFTRSGCTARWPIPPSAPIATPA